MAKCNVGRTEQVIRIIIGAVILLAGWWFKTWWGLIGIIPLVTAFIRWCPISQLLKINTCREEQPKTM